MKPIFTSFSPNATYKDLLTIGSFFLFPWNWKRWKRGAKVEKLGDLVSTIIDQEPVFFDSARTALSFLVESMIEDGDEVILQAFTCVVVPNAIKEGGGVPVYVDVDSKRLTMDLNDLKKKITSKTKMIVVQHTFGALENMNEVMQLAKEHNLKVIEDCAHIIGGSYKGQPLGTIGDGAIFSFGTDKVLSCVRGGCATSKHSKVMEFLQKKEATLPYPSTKTLLRRVMHPFFFAVAMPLYNVGKFGKILLFVGKKLHLFSHIMTRGEKKSVKGGWKREKFANILAAVAMNQWKDVEKINKHRQKRAREFAQLCKKYDIPFQVGMDEKGAVPLRFTLFVKKQAKVFAEAKRLGIYLGDWYTSVIAPKDADYRSAGYKDGSCAHAEKVVKHVVNLPTHRFIKERELGQIGLLLHAISEKDYV